MQSSGYDVSVIVLCYNPDIGKLKQTLDSIIKQRAVKIEVIISDDGSNTNYRSDIENYIGQWNEVGYKYINSKRNTGTVKNVIRGMRACSADYVKLISPGDALTGGDVLSGWLEKTIEGRAAWSFGRAIYYHRVDGDGIAIDRVKASPCILKSYRSNSKLRSRYDYVVNCDFCLGAATLVRRDIMLRYLSLIDDKVRFAEDSVYLLMMANRETCLFYDEPVVYYEFSGGISNKADDGWEQILRKDYISAYGILLDVCDLEPSMRREAEKVYHTVQIDRWLTRNIRSIAIRGRIRYWIDKLLYAEYSCDDIRKKSEVH